MAHTITINGEPVTIGDFKAYKGMLAGEILTEAEGVYREVMRKTGEVKAEWMRSHIDVLPRALARQKLAPRVLHDKVVDSDGLVVKLEPIIVGGTVTVLEGGGRHVQDGTPMIGPDPLGHLTDADWAASGQELRIPEEPSSEQLFAAMIPVVFKLAQAQVMRLIALTLVSNADLQRWDTDEGLDFEGICARLDEQASKLKHSASMAELIRMLADVLEIVRDQVQDPFVETRQRVTETMEALRAGPVEAEVPLQPMTLEPEPDAEPDSTPPSSASSTPLVPGTDGLPTSPSTASRGGELPG